MRRKTAKQIARNDDVKYDKPHRNWVISKEEIQRLRDANNNVENTILLDSNGNKTAPMGPSNSHVESALGFVNQSTAGCSEPSSREAGTRIDKESKASAKCSGGSKDRKKKHRHSRKKSRNREKEKDSKRHRRSRSKSQGKSSKARKLNHGENPNCIPWRLIEIDQESLPEPCDPRTKLNWMEEERRQKRERLSAKYIEIFGEDSDEDIEYRGLPSAARIRKWKKQRTDSDSSIEESTVSPDDDTEFNEQTADRRSPILLLRKSKKKRKRNLSEETVTLAKRKTSKGYSTPSYVPSAALSFQIRENRGDSTPPTSDVPTDPEDPNYQPSHPLACIPLRDPSSRRIFNRYQKIDRKESSATITSSSHNEPEKRPSMDEASLESASTTELWGGKEVDKNKRDSGFNTDLSFTAAASNIKSVAASRGHSVIGNKSHAIPSRKKASDCIKGLRTDAENEESAITDGPTTKKVATQSSLGDPLLNCIDSEVEKASAGSLKSSSPLRLQRISEVTANPSSTTEMELSDRLLGALDKIFLYLSNRRRLKEREKSASKLAIQRNRQEELLKAEQEFQSGLKLFQTEFLFLLENLSTLEQVLKFISQGLDHRTPVGVRRFTQAEVRLAMREAGMEDKSGDVKLEPSVNEEDVCLVGSNILTIDLTQEESVEQDMCDSSTDPPVQHQRVTKIELNEANQDCSTSKKPAELMHDLNANEIPLTVPSIAEVMTISRQQFETIDEKLSLGCASEHIKDPCLMCSLASRVACGRCFGANYCSKKCQVIHWEHYHHVTCVPRQAPILQ